MIQGTISQPSAPGSIASHPGEERTYVFLSSYFAGTQLKRTEVNRGSRISPTKKRKKHGIYKKFPFL